jgi:hypothetical protein
MHISNTVYSKKNKNKNKTKPKKHTNISGSVFQKSLKAKQKFDT